MVYLTIIIINNIVYFIQDSLDCFPFIAYCSWMGSNKRKKCEKETTNSRFEWEWDECETVELG